MKLRRSPQGEREREPPCTVGEASSVPATALDSELLVRWERGTIRHQGEVEVHIESTIHFASLVAWGLRELWICSSSTPKRGADGSPPPLPVSAGVSAGGSSPGAPEDAEAHSRLLGPPGAGAGQVPVPVM